MLIYHMYKDTICCTAIDSEQKNMFVAVTPCTSPTDHQPYLWSVFEVCHCEVSPLSLLCVTKEWLRVSSLFRAKCNLRVCVCSGPQRFIITSFCYGKVFVGENCEPSVSHIQRGQHHVWWSFYNKIFLSLSFVPACSLYWMGEKYFTILLHNLTITSYFQFPRCSPMYFFFKWSCSAFLSVSAFSCFYLCWLPHCNCFY